MKIVDGLPELPKLLKMEETEKKKQSDQSGQLPTGYQPEPEPKKLASMEPCRKSGNRTGSRSTVATAGELEKARGKAIDRSTGTMWKSEKGKQKNSARKS